MLGLTQSSCQGMDDHGRWSPSSAQGQHGDGDVGDEEEEEASEVDARDITKDVVRGPGMIRKVGCAMALMISATLTVAVFYVIIFIK